MQVLLRFAVRPEQLRRDERPAHKNATAETKGDEKMEQKTRRQIVINRKQGMTLEEIANINVMSISNVRRIIYEDAPERSTRSGRKRLRTTTTTSDIRLNRFARSTTLTTNICRQSETNIKPAISAERSTENEFYLHDGY